MRPFLKPLQGEALVFWTIPGDILWRADGRPTPITRDMAVSLRGVYRAEARAARMAGDRPANELATKLWAQLGEALDAHDRWLRLVGRPAQSRRESSLLSDCLATSTTKEA